jgi:hypothetical protein
LAELALIYMGKKKVTAYLIRKHFRNLWVAALQMLRLELLDMAIKPQ